MIIYFKAMRIKDDKKIDALHAATIKLVNEVGFASSSVSKIAREANVSPATLYVYYNNKEELLVATYVEIKKKMSAYLMESFDASLPIRDILKDTWKNMFRFAIKNPEEMRYTDQFANSPYSSLVDKQKLEPYFKPLFDVMLSGIEQKIIKDVDFDILTAFMFQPVIFLANRNVCTAFELTDENIETAFKLAWDAIRL